LTALISVFSNYSFAEEVTREFGPWPMTSISLIAGAEFDGRLELEDSDGDTFARSEYDAAPVLGITFSSRF